MTVEATQLECIVELKPGEKLALPSSLLDNVGPGRWLVSVRLCTQRPGDDAVRRHDAFLRGYAPEDEGLYDDFAR